MLDRQYCILKMDLNEIVAVMDVDGYQINKTFYCKELGFLKMGEETASSFFFDIGVRWKSLSEKEKSSCRWVCRNIHRLLFGIPQHCRKFFPINGLENIVQHLYNHSARNQHSIVAYKGGHLEKNVLRNLGIPAINLESLGCPKATVLFHDLVWLETCGNHVEACAFDHCPKVEVEAYGAWLEKHV